MYQVELVWNREFHFVSYGQPKNTLDEAKKYAIDLRNMGDGARVKKVRVLNMDTDEYIESYQF